MKLLFVSADDYQDVNVWAGTPHAMYSALGRQDLELEVIGPLKQRFELPFKAVQAMRNAVGQKRYNRARETIIVNGYARAIESKARQFRPDVIFCPSSVPMAAVRSTAVKVFWTDATFAGIVGYYPDFFDISRRHLALGHKMEQAALRNCELAVYSSDWARQSAEANYAANADRLAVIPFGANIVDPGPVDNLRTECRLLLVGKDWVRKGADVAIATVRQLRSRGTNATIDIVGCQPPEGTAIESFVTVHGLLNKTDSVQAKLLDDLYRSAAFFILPTQAECAGIVLAEAQAYGLPVVGSDTGGMMSMIDPGVSGNLFANETFVRDASEAVAQIWADPYKYRSTGQAARRFYEKTLNWDSATTELLHRVEAVRS